MQLYPTSDGPSLGMQPYAALPNIRWAFAMPTASKHQMALSYAHRYQTSDGSFQCPSLPNIRWTFPMPIATTHQMGLSYAHRYQTSDGPFLCPSLPNIRWAFPMPIATKHQMSLSLCPSLPNIRWSFRYAHRYQTSDGPFARHAAKAAGSNTTTASLFLKQMLRTNWKVFQHSIDYQNKIIW